MKYLFVILSKLKILGTNLFVLSLSYIMLYLSSFLVYMKVIWLPIQMSRQLFLKNLKYEVNHHDYLGTSITKKLKNV